MNCNRCGGKVLLERLFSSNKDFETSCIICGDRKFVPKDSELGVWLAKREKALGLAQGTLSNDKKK
jgi:hypothetical protein